MSHDSGCSNLATSKYSGFFEEPNMTFEEWMKRPVYVAQCKTAALAGELGINGWHFRRLPAYRSDQDRADRKLIADTMRQLRKRK
jgi:hypothetical protein